jgi:ribosomal protein L18
VNFHNLARKKKKKKKVQKEQMIFLGKTLAQLAKGKNLEVAIFGEQISISH